MMDDNAIYVKGPVLSPGWIGRPELGKIDRPLTAGEIQKAAYQFPIGSPLFNINQPIVDVQHRFEPIAISVEQFITPEQITFNEEVYALGTWFLTSKVTDPIIKEAIRAGILTGYSVGAFPEEYRTALVEKGLFSGVEEGKWFPLAVSIVKRPFYPKAVFKVFGPDDIIKKSFNSKSEVNKMSDEKPSVVETLVNALISKSDGKGKEYENQLENKVRDLKEEITDLKEDNARLNRKVERLTKVEDTDKDKDKTKDKDKDKDKDKNKDKDKEKDTDKDKEKEKDKEKDTDKDKEKDKDTDKEKDKEKQVIDKDNDKIIKKSLDIDDAKKGGTDKSFMDNIGHDSFGRNKKYL